MWTIEELAEALGISRPTAYRWKKAGKFPPHVQVQGRHLWDESQVRAWLGSAVNGSGVTWGQLLRIDDEEWAAMVADPAAAAWTTERPVDLTRLDALLGSVGRLRREAGERFAALEAEIQAIMEAALPK